MRFERAGQGKIEVYGEKWPMCVLTESDDGWLISTLYGGKSLSHRSVLEIAEKLEELNRVKGV